MLNNDKKDNPRNESQKTETIKLILDKLTKKYSMEEIINCLFSSNYKNIEIKKIIDYLVKEEGQLKIVQLILQLSDDLDAKNEKINLNSNTNANINTNSNTNTNTNTNINSDTNININTNNNNNNANTNIDGNAKINSNINENKRVVSHSKNYIIYKDSSSSSRSKSKDNKNENNKLLSPVFSKINDTSQENKAKENIVVDKNINNTEQFNKNENTYIIKNGNENENENIVLEEEEITISISSNENSENPPSPNPEENNKINTNNNDDEKNKKNSGEVVRTLESVYINNNSLINKKQNNNTNNNNNTNTKTNEPSTFINKKRNNSINTFNNYNREVNNNNEKVYYSIEATKFFKYKFNNIDRGIASFVCNDENCKGRAIYNINKQIFKLVNKHTILNSEHNYIKNMSKNDKKYYETMKKEKIIGQLINFKKVKNLFDIKSK